ncbi:Error-prone DNA polymerase [uncultured archaeon]|nr:Error-prone DNA polymerase [uncultured archaeon]
MRVAFHVHTTKSDGTATPKEMVDAAAKLGLDGMVITDHDSVLGGLEAQKNCPHGFLIITGAEVSSSDGHILAVDVKENIPPGLSAKETVEKIHALGGLAVAPHPYDLYRGGVGDLIKTVPFDAVETINGHTTLNRKNPAKAAKETGLPTIGGQDSHTTYELDNILIEYEGDLRQAIKENRVRTIKQPPSVIIPRHIRYLIMRWRHPKERLKTFIKRLRKKA